MDIITTYDIADVAEDRGRRLRDVAAACETFGIRSQFSVFECRISEAGLAQLLARIQDAIDPSTDSVYVYRLSGSIEACRTTTGFAKHHLVDKP